MAETVIRTMGQMLLQQANGQALRFEVEPDTIGLEVHLRLYVETIAGGQLAVGRITLRADDAYTLGQALLKGASEVIQRIGPLAFAPVPESGANTGQIGVADVQ